MNLGNSLFQARKRCGYTQEEVSEKLRVSRQTFQNGKLMKPFRIFVNLKNGSALSYVIR